MAKTERYTKSDNSKRRVVGYLSPKATNRITKFFADNGANRVPDKRFTEIKSESELVDKAISLFLETALKATI